MGLRDSPQMASRGSEAMHTPVCVTKHLLSLWLKLAYRFKTCKKVKFAYLVVQALVALNLKELCVSITLSIFATKACGVEANRMPI